MRSEHGRGGVFVKMTLNFLDFALSSDSIRPGPTSTWTSEPNFHIVSRDPTPCRPNTILESWQRAVLGAFSIGSLTIDISDT